MQTIAALWKRVDRAGFAAALALAAASGCLGTRMVKLKHLDVETRPTSRATPDWKADVAELLARYEAAPVVGAGDDRLEPIFGGLSTLTYFGTDLAQKALDQQIPAQWQRPGLTLGAACNPGGGVETGATPETLRVSQPLPEPSGPTPSPEAPTFVGVWVPISLSGEPVPAEARCSELGQAIEPEKFRHFCMFARLGLQPTGNHSLVMVVHGLFDSGAQEYVQRIATVLYRLGHSVLLPDMRDHGDTLRAAPQVATTLGTLEGGDVLALVRAARAACGSQVTAVGAVGVSGGGLDVIRAFTEDREHALDAGVIAISPLLDVDAAIADVGDRGSCPVTTAIEVTWADTLVLAFAGGASAFGGAALVQGLEGDPIDENAAIVAGVGAGVGLLFGLAADAFLDGGSQSCVSQRATAGMFGDMLQQRWRTLRARTDVPTLSPAGRRIEPAAVDLAEYVHERAEFLASQAGRPLRRFDAAMLARDLHTSAVSRKGSGARLLILGANDDPVTRRPALHALARRTADLPDVYVRAVEHGGHGAMWIVQPTIMRELFARHFGKVTDPGSTSSDPTQTPP